MTSSPATASYLIARLAGVQIALPASRVIEILRTVALAAMPGAPAIVEGALNLRGTLVPVIDLRLRFSLTARPNNPGDSLIVLQAASRRIAVRVETVDELEEIAAESIENPAAMSPVLARLSAVSGVAARADGALVIYDPDAFLTQAENDAIAATLGVAT